MSAIPIDNRSNIAVAFRKWVDVHQDNDKDEAQAVTPSDDENGSSPR